MCSTGEHIYTSCKLGNGNLVRKNQMLSCSCKYSVLLTSGTNTSNWRVQVKFDLIILEMVLSADKVVSRGIVTNNKSPYSAKYTAQSMFEQQGV